ncbi:MAG: efflux RND transporter periplasmic adaptor subunit [Chloracidobacterium sp.]|nr:efflux RND transporter periplasmic adaptor subunit [Chloracidobacterium sp.]
MARFAFHQRWWRALRPAVWTVQLACLTLPLWTAAGCRSAVKTAEATAAASGPVPVKTVAVAVRRRPQFIAAAGTVTAARRAAVAPNAPGRVVETPVTTGAFVEAGSVLARLDDREAHQRLEQARAALAQAEAADAQLRARFSLEQGAFDPQRLPEAEAAQADLTAAEADAQLAAATLSRYERLARNDNITRAMLDEARANAEKTQAVLRAARRRYEATLRGLQAEYIGLRAAAARVADARAAVALAERAVDDMTVRAPFAGYVAERFVNVGEYATPDRPAVELVALDQLKLELRLPETDAAKVRRGQEVEAATDAHPGFVIRGKVTAIRPLVDAAARRLAVEVAAPNPERKLRPGMFVTARLLLDEASLRLLIPRTAVFQHAILGTAAVYVVENNRACLRLVQTDETVENEVFVRQGLKEGEKIVVSNLEKIRDGENVIPAD